MKLRKSRVRKYTITVETEGKRFHQVIITDEWDNATARKWIMESCINHLEDEVEHALQKQG